MITAEEVAKRIRIPLKRWPGNCSGIVKACLKAGVVKGKFRYGVWLGKIHRKSVFGGRAFSHHAWVKTPDGGVFDPTRWCFTLEKPRIFTSEERESDLREYDFGGNRLHAHFRRPCPGVSATDKKVTLTLPESTMSWVASQVRDARVSGNKIVMDYGQVFWLGNTPLHLFPDKTTAGVVLKALVKAGHSSVIPWDNYEEVLGPHKKG